MHSYSIHIATYICTYGLQPTYSHGPCIKVCDMSRTAMSILEITASRVQPQSVCFN